MFSVTTPAARALAHRWGELDEEPPEFVDDLMVDLTAALAEAETAGQRARAECLDDVLDALAEGIVKHDRPVDGGFDEVSLSSAVADLRAYYYEEHARRRGRVQSGGPPPLTDADWTLLASPEGA